MNVKNPFSNSIVFDKTAHYILLGIVLSLAFSIRFINSFSIILLVVLVTFHPDRLIWVRKAFSNTYFLACFALLVLKAAGLLYTEDREDGWWQVTSKAALFAIPFFFSHFKSSAREMRRLVLFFSLSLALVSLICLANAVRLYYSGNDSSVFFYHSLMLPFNHHAIFFSFYLLFCIVYWMEDGLSEIHQRKQKYIIFFLLMFFYVMIILLSSKLVIVFSTIYLLYLLIIRNYRSNRTAAITGFLIVISVLVIAFTNNPVKDRFTDLTNGSTGVFSQQTFSPDVYLNGLQFRLLTWRFTYEILNTENAWIAGVSPADAQPKLISKYKNANLYQGNGKDDKGYLAYNCHNVFLQTTLESGLTGLVLVLIIIGSFFRMAFRERKTTAIVFFLSILAFCFTESVLSSQYAMLLFLFFPLLMLSSAKVRSSV